MKIDREREEGEMCGMCEREKAEREQVYELD